MLKVRRGTLVLETARMLDIKECSSSAVEHFSGKIGPKNGSKKAEEPLQELMPLGCLIYVTKCDKKAEL
jgi:hypothetical protein